jgi:hypothetical protein
MNGGPILFMKNRTVIQAIITAAIWLTISTSTYAMVTVESIEGAVNVNGESVTVGDSIQLNDQINSTGADTSYLDLSLPNGNKIRLQNARGGFLSLSETVKLKLDRGKAFSYFEPSDTSSQFKIVTDHGIAGIRGTKFFLQAKPNQMYVCVCRGTVQVQKTGFWANLFGEVRPVKAGHDIHVYQDESLPQAKRSPRMVRRTWAIFQEMGFKAPERFQ